MQRAKRIAVAAVLTVADVATFNSYAGVIWRTWGHDPWAKAALVGLLSLWVASAVVIWGHVSNDMRHTFHERNFARSRNPARAPRAPRRDSDV
jgi:hypothetical protein